MKLEFGYGKTVQAVECPAKNLMGILRANAMEHERSGEAAVEYALAHPVDSKPLRELVRTGQKVAVITSDISRPMPSYEVLPSVLDELYRGGIRREDITVVFALGSHRKHTEEEKRHLVGERVYREVATADSDPEDYVNFGTTSRGTPIDVTRTVAEADVRICVGNIEFHYFAGFSGGVKALMPGVSTWRAIENNHRMTASEYAASGLLDGNPVREDIEEFGQRVGVDFIVNVVLDEKKHTVYAVAGHPVTAHRVGVEYLRRMYRIPIEKRADIVLVSQGGAPKDGNLYQSQKALENAKYAVRPGGTIILIAACGEGFGSAVVEQWMLCAQTPADAYARVKREYQLGAHKAVAIFRVLENAEVDLVSELEPDYVRRLHMVPKASAQEALDDALKRYGPDAAVLAMPYGGATMPYAKELQSGENRDTIKQ